VNRHSIVFLGAGRAALLQLAHPAVAYAIERHSRTRDDPFGRFQRTFARVFAMVFGDLDSALGAARAVHAVHSAIEGEIPAEAGPPFGGARYHANDPEALLWVHATLFDTSLLVFELVAGRLPETERERYYAETLRFAALFGIPAEVLPPDRRRFEAYVAGMLEGDRLRVTPPAARMGRFVLRAPHPALAPLSAGYRLLTGYLLPERLAEGFGLSRGGEAGRQLYAAILALLRAGHPRWPRRLRYLPAYLEARRRLAGRTDPDWLGERFSRLLVGGSGRGVGPSAPAGPAPGI
jgi:uncharacterized protein (DUF2236 family)